MMMETLAPAPLSVRFAWDREEYVRSVQDTDRHARTSLFQWATWAVLALVYVNLFRSINSITDTLVFALAIGGVLFMWRMQPALMRQYARIRERELGMAGQFIVTAFSDDGIRRAGPGGEVFREWTSIRGAVETGEFLLIYPRPGFAFYLPRRALPAHTLHAVRATLRAHLGARATLRAD